MHNAQPRPYFGSYVTSRNVRDACLIEAQYGAGTRIPEHVHESAYLSLVLRGGYTEQMASGAQSCAAGTAIFHPAGERHSDRFDGNTGRLFMIEPSASW